VPSNEVHNWLVVLLIVGIVAVGRKVLVNLVDALGGALSKWTALDGAYLRAWMWSAFLWAPSPVFACFDGCLGPQLMLPFAISWVPFLTIFSWLFPRTWLWHVVFMVPFLGVFIPLDLFLEPRIRGRSSRTAKRAVMLVVFVAYWAGVGTLWSYIPLQERQALLGQSA